MAARRAIEAVITTEGVGRMFVLVTQADGSARRIPFVSYALAIGLVAAFFSLSPDPSAMTNLAASRDAAFQFFNEHPYTEVAPRFDAIIPVSYAQTMRAEYIDGRRQLGLPLIADRTVQRAQEKLDVLLYQAHEERMNLPLWRRGVMDSSSPPVNLLAHIGVHATGSALLISLVFLLCTAIPLEDGWGSILFGLFAAAAVVLSAKTSVALGYTDSVGAPWIGASGLVAACLGATLVRSLHGARLLGIFPMPGWILLPLWCALELVGQRGMTSSESIVTEALNIYVVAGGFGLLISAGVGLLGFERRSIARATDSKELVSNPALEKAMQAREKQELDLAFDLLRRELRVDPDNQDVAIALWDVAFEMGKAHQALDALMLVIRRELKSGHADVATRHWLNASSAVPDIDIDPVLGVRLAEAVLDEGNPDDAMVLLSRVVGGSIRVPTPAALRIVRISRDLDPDVARRAATIALEDVGLSLAEREDLLALSEEVVAVSHRQTVAQPAPEPLEPQRPVAAAMIDEGDLEATGPDLAPAAQEASRWDDATDELDLDPNALSLDSLAEEPGASEGPEDVEVEDWNSPGMLKDLGAGTPDDTIGAIAADFDDLTVSDLDDASLAETHLDGLSDIDIDDHDDDGALTRVTRDDTAAIPTRVDLSRDSQGSHDGGDTTAPIGVGDLRPLRAREALPVELGAEGLVIEVDEGRKTSVPYARIQAVSACAVKGLSDKPVLLVDLALNWRSSGEPLKLIRLRSDRFDPKQMVPTASSPLEALQTMLTRIIEASGATPLPNFNAATGAPFAVHESVDVYQRDVLNAAG